MTIAAFKVGLLVRLDTALRVRCCQAQPIPSGTVVVLFALTSPNRAQVGLYFGPDYDAANPPYHHAIRPLGELDIELAQQTGRTFPGGGFCCHQVKRSGIHGEIIGALSAEARSRLGLPVA